MSMAWMSTTADHGAGAPFCPPHEHVYATGSNAAFALGTGSTQKQAELVCCLPDVMADGNQTQKTAMHSN